MTSSTVPPATGWQDITPAEAGFDPSSLADATAFAVAAETDWPRELGRGLSADPKLDEPAPWNEVLGPTRERGAPNGLVTRGGLVAARWGDTTRVDMTFSVAKSYLAVLAGIALREGLIRDLDDRVADHALDDGFTSPQNRDITWRHFLHQSSEWEGELWSKPDLVDRNRQVGVGADNSRKGTHRDLSRAGSVFEYNDVRVNRFSLALLEVFREPLPEVLAREVMQPIGASSTWQWHGYRNSSIRIDGRELVSVPGGGHWGGGIFINSEDHARFGLMVCRDGCWGARRVLPEGFVRELGTPSPTHPGYGYLWWLNSDRRLYPSAPASSIFAMGAGSSLIWVDPELDLVAVVRWIDISRFDAFAGRVMQAMG